MTAWLVLAVATLGGCATTDPPPVAAPATGPSTPTDTPVTSSPVASAEPPGPTTTAPVGPLGGVPAVPTAPATALVDRLVVSAGDATAGDYRRDAFGGGWDYDPGTGCNTRELVLVEESRTPATMGERCKPLAGDWVSAYDGLTTRDPADLEIDHLVALADAWRSGAARWTAERREAYANDLDDPATLQAVTIRSNRSKGDDSPDEWLPTAAGARCDYVAGWVRVKARWGLTVTPAEKSTLVQVLSGC